jgi:hypothetical protein
MSLDRVNGSPIIDINTADVRCTCTLELISRRQRPYHFRATVTGDPPHAMRRVYEISANSDAIAANLAMERFMKEMQSPLHVFGNMV